MTYYMASRYRLRVLLVGQVAFAVVFLYFGMSVRRAQHRCGVLDKLTSKGAEIVFSDDKAEPILWHDLVSLFVSEEGLREVETIRCGGFYTTSGTSPQVVNDLKIIKSEIGDADVDLILQIDELRDLVLTGTAITDQGVQELVDLQNLNNLTLSYTEITDKSVSALASLDAARSIDVVGTKLSKEGVRKLEIRLANCEVYSSYNATERSEATSARNEQLVPARAAETTLTRPFLVE